MLELTALLSLLSFLVPGHLARSSTRYQLLTGEETGVIETYKFLAKLCLDWLLSFTKKSLVKFLRNVLKEFSGML